MSQRNGGVKTRAFKAAFPKVLPICISFFFLAMSYGVLMGTPAGFRSCGRCT